MFCPRHSSYQADTDSFGFPVTYVVSDWQTLDVDSPRGSGFFEFCDALEVQGGEVAPASGWGARTAIEAWARYYRTTYLPTRTFLPLFPRDQNLTGLHIVFLVCEGVDVK